MVAVLVWVKFGRELPGICSGGGGGGVLLLCSGESLVLLCCCLVVCLFVLEEGTTGAGMAAGGPILAPGIKQEDLHHHALEQLPGLAYCINDNPHWGKQTHHHTLTFLFLITSQSMLCHVELFHFDLET